MKIKNNSLPNSNKKWKNRLFFGLIIIGFFIPFLVDGYKTYEYTLAFAYGIAIMGLCVLTGLNGQFSVGHGAFIALGGYTTAVMIDYWGVSGYFTIPVAGLICFLAGVLFGNTALRLNFVGLTLTTLALALATPQLLKSHHFEKWTGGVQGIYLEKPPIPSWLPLSEDQWWYFITFALLLGHYWVASNLVKSRSGRAIIAIRDHPIAAKSMGINVTLYKSLTFGVSAFYTGVAGSIMAILKDFIAPDQFDFSFSVSLVIGLVIGGIGSVSGAIFGGLFLQFLPVSSILKSGVIGGILLIVAVYFLPQGAIYLANQFLTNLKINLDRDS